MSVQGLRTSYHSSSTSRHTLADMVNSLASGVAQSKKLGQMTTKEATSALNQLKELKDKLAKDPDGLKLKPEERKAFKNALASVAKQIYSRSLNGVSQNSLQSTLDAQANSNSQIDNSSKYASMNFKYNQKAQITPVEQSSKLNILS